MILLCLLRVRASFLERCQGYYTVPLGLLDIRTFRMVAQWYTVVWKMGPNGCDNSPHLNPDLLPIEILLDSIACPECWELGTSKPVNWYIKLDGSGREVMKHKTSFKLLPVDANSHSESHQGTRASRTPIVMCLPHQTSLRMNAKHMSDRQ